MPDLTKLDAPALKSFIDGELHRFQMDLSEMRAPAQTPMSLYDVTVSQLPLSIGLLASDSDTGGKTVITNLVKAAGAIDAVFNRHSTGFDDLKRNLEEVITTMLQTQGDNLTTVDGQKFLTAISDYDHDMSGGNSHPPTPGT